MLEYFEIADKYKQMFGDDFPTMCFPTDTIEETKKKMQMCMDRKKSAWELFDLRIDPDISY